MLILTLGFYLTYKSYYVFAITCFNCQIEGANQKVWLNNTNQANFKTDFVMDVGDATSTTSMDVVKIGLENQVGLELQG